MFVPGFRRYPLKPTSEMKPSLDSENSELKIASQRALNPLDPTVKEIVSRFDREFSQRRNAALATAEGGADWRKADLTHARSIPLEC
jgi:hypothetical protein